MRCCVCTYIKVYTLHALNTFMHTLNTTGVRHLSKNVILSHTTTEYRFSVDAALNTDVRHYTFINGVSWAHTQQHCPLGVILQKLYEK